MIRFHSRGAQPSTILDLDLDLDLDLFLHSRGAQPSIILVMTDDSLMMRRFQDFKISRFQDSKIPNDIVL